MMRSRSFPSIVTCGACVLALACGHEAAAPSPLSGTAARAPDAVVAVPTTAAVRSASQCIEMDAELGGERATLAGRLFVDDAHEHPARGKTHPFILRLDIPRCVVGIETRQVTEVQLASGEGVTLKPLVGRHVTVSGDPFVAHTGWHARPIVLMTTTATPL